MHSTVGPHLLCAHCRCGIAGFDCVRNPSITRIEVGLKDDMGLSVPPPERDLLGRRTFKTASASAPQKCQLLLSQPAQQQALGIGFKWLHGW